MTRKVSNPPDDGRRSVASRGQDMADPVRASTAHSPPAEVPTALTDLHTAAEALRRQIESLTRAWHSAEASRAHTRRLFELLPEGYLVTDVTGVIQDANFAASTLLQTPTHYLVGRSLLHYIPPDMRPPLRSWLADPEAAGPTRTWSVRLQPRSGAPFDAMLTVIVARDRSGNVGRIHWIVRDIATPRPPKERIRAPAPGLGQRIPGRTFRRVVTRLSRNELLAHLQAAHARTQETAELIIRLQAITAALSEARTPDQVAAVIVEWGAQALDASAACMALLDDAATAVTIAHAVGIPEEVCGRWRHFPLTSPSAVTRVLRTGAPIFPESGEAVSGTDPLLADLHALHDNTWTVVPLLVGQRPIGALVFILSKGHWLTEDERSFLMNLTHLGAQALERARLQEREIRTWAESERLQKTLLNAIAHDLKTPLTTVQGCLDTVLTEGDRLEPAVRQELLTVAHQGVKHFNRLVTGILQMRRLETGMMHLQREPANLADVVQSAVEEVSSSLDRARYTVDLPDGLPLIPMDTLLMSHVLINLLDNAAKYSAPETRIDVGARLENEHIVISVADQGTAGSPEHLNQVFDGSGPPGEPLTSDRAGGSGLGLTIARGFVEAHKGRIWAAQQDGGGMVVNVRIPIG